METYRLKTTPSSPMGKAISYFITSWKRLTAYLDNVRTLVDNNPVKRAIRVSAIGFLKADLIKPADPKDNDITVIAKNGTNIIHTRRTISCTPPMRVSGITVLYSAW